MRYPRSKPFSVGNMSVLMLKGEPCAQRAVETSRAVGAKASEKVAWAACRPAAFFIV